MTSRRLIREEKTIAAMIRIYCRGIHDTQKGLCPECTALLEYAHGRLVKCPYQEQKPTCTKCPIHCYKPAMREKVREAMRYAGPRMIRYHPILAVIHLIDGRREIPDKPPRRGKEA